jgi:signal transduction histidine kinase/CheY-like chemotaxis protein
MRWPLGARWVVVIALTSWAAFTMPAQAQMQGTMPQRHDQAEFRLATQASWQPVSLPDTWSLRGIGPRQIGHYRLSVRLPAVPEVMWALHFDRLDVLHEVRLNGALIHGTLGLHEVVRRPVPTMITVPPMAWRAGVNEIEILVNGGVGSGLSSMLAGPEARLSARFLWSHHQTTTLAQILNSASAGISLFMLMIWWRRRHEVALGCFALLSLLAALRNHAYFMVGTQVSASHANALYFLAQVVTVVLLGFFAMAYAQHHPRPLRRALQVTAAAAPALAIAGSLSGQMHALRTWLYPWLAVLGLCSLGLILRSARDRRSALDWALVVTLGAVVLAGVHDYLFQQGHTSVMDSFWMPYVVPLFTGVFSIALLDRVVKALRDAEGLNAVLEQRVTERTQALVQANQAKTRFLAAASHDLRQPMVSIGLLVGLLRDQAHAPAVNRIVARLQEATLGMEDLFKRLLDLSRLESGTVRSQQAPVALQGLFDAIDTHQREPASQKGLRLRLRPSTAIVDSDPLLLEQILRNLVANAVRYTRHGGVLVAARPDGPGHVRVAVWDTGPGIAAQQQALIFEEFVQINPTERSAADAPGLGLGLSIAKRCAELLGTPIQLRSRLGRGSCFSVRVALSHSPRRHTLQRPGPLATPAPAATSAIDGLQGCVVWLLEDHPHVRHSLQLQLEHWGMQVRSFDTCQSLHDHLHGHAHDGVAAPPPALLVTDQNLPDGLGTDVLARLRERWPDLPGVVVTGDTAPHEWRLLAALATAGTPVLHKPCTAPALRAAVATVLPNR